MSEIEKRFLMVLDSGQIINDTEWVNMKTKPENARMIELTEKKKTFAISRSVNGIYYQSAEIMNKEIVLVGHEVYVLNKDNIDIVEGVKIIDDSSYVLIMEANQWNQFLEFLHFVLSDDTFLEEIVSLETITRTDILRNNLEAFLNYTSQISPTALIFKINEELAMTVKDIVNVSDSDSDFNETFAKQLSMTVDEFVELSDVWWRSGIEKWVVNLKD